MLGQRLNLLTVMARAPNKPGTNAHWLCKCECGSTSVVAGTALRKGTTKSCGCLRTQRIVDATRKHGASLTPEFKTWCGIKRRCLNPKATNYERYGGRGIGICAEWKDNFAQFIADVGPRPTPLHSIDRFPNNDGDYEPGNVRWATAKQQAANRRRPRRTTTIDRFRRESGQR